MKEPAGALVSSSNLLQPGPGQELGVPSQKRAGTPGHQEAARRDKGNLDKAVLHDWPGHGTWEQKVGIPPVVPLHKGQQGGTVENCPHYEQRVLLLLPQPKNIK